MFIKQKRHFQFNFNLKTFCKKTVTMSCNNNNAHRDIENE